VELSFCGFVSRLLWQLVKLPQQYHLLQLLAAWLPACMLPLLLLMLLRLLFWEFAKKQKVCCYDEVSLRSTGLCSEYL